MPGMLSLEQAVVMFDLESAADQVRYGEQERQRV